MANWTQKLRAEIYYALGPHPTPYFLLWNLLHPGADHQVHAKTQIVIEGFPRSSNSFADAAFRIAQLPDHVHQAHHIHVPAQIMRGVQRGLPCVVLIREPAAAVVSTAIYDSANSMRHHLRAYIRFYKSLLRYEDRFVTALFDQVITDFGQIIQRVNKRFDTRFADFDHTEANEQAVMDVLGKEGRRAEGEKFESRVARPNEARKADQERLKQELSGSAYTTLMEEAQALYRRYEAFAQQDDE